MHVLTLTGRLGVLSFDVFVEGTQGKFSRVCDAFIAAIEAEAKRGVNVVEFEVSATQGTLEVSDCHITLYHILTFALFRLLGLM